MLGETVVDTHAHYWPSELVTAMQAGERWHGWWAERGKNDDLIVTSDAGVVPFRPGRMESWGDRISRRKRESDVDVEVIMLPSFLWNYHLAAPDAVAFCRDANDELAAIEQQHPGAVIGFGVLPLQDVKATEEALEYAVKELGLRAFAIGTHVEGRNFDDPAVVPALRAVLEADVALAMHGNYFNRIGEDRLTRYYFGNSFAVPLESSLAVMSIIYSGLLDEVPTARIASMHGGGWIHYGIGRFLLRHAQDRDGGGLQAPPDTYLSRFYYDCLVHDELALELMVRRAGADRIMLGTDYPFGGDIVRGAASWVRGLGFLTTREKEMILGGNAWRFLALEGNPWAGRVARPVR